MPCDCCVLCHTYSTKDLFVCFLISPWRQSPFPMKMTTYVHIQFYFLDHIYIKTLVQKNVPKKLASSRDERYGARLAQSKSNSSLHLVCTRCRTSFQRLRHQGYLIHWNLPVILWVLPIIYIFFSIRAFMRDKNVAYQKYSVVDTCVVIHIHTTIYIRFLKIIFPPHSVPTHYPSSEIPTHPKHVLPIQKTDERISM